MDFSNKVAVVTGATRGIGKATAELLVASGAKVIATGRNEKALTELSEKYRDKMLTYCCDASDEDSVNKMIADATEKTGGIDILINNAGIHMEDKGLFVEQNSAVWKKKIDTNIYGTLYPTHAVLPQMMERRYGRIVNLASVAGIYGICNMLDYSLTKGAIIAFTAGLAREVGPYNVTVNAVSPGNINTYADLPDYSYLNRSGTPEECANVICFLASDEASFVSGANYIVDGSRKKL